MYSIQVCFTIYNVLANILLQLIIMYLPLNRSRFTYLATLINQLPHLRHVQAVQNVRCVRELLLVHKQLCLLNRKSMNQSLLSHQLDKHLSRDRFASKLSWLYSSSSFITSNHSINVVAQHTHELGLDF